MAGSAWDRIDSLLEKSGAGAALDAMAALFFEQALPSDGLRHKGTSAQIAGFLPYRGYSGASKIFTNLNSIGWVLELSPLTGGTEQMDSVLSGLFEEGFPDDLQVQVSTYASPYIGDLLERWAYPRVKQGGVMEKMGRARAENMRRMIWSSGSKTGPFFARDYRVFISVSMEKKRNSEQTIKTLKEVRERVSMGLKTLGVASRNMDASDLMSLVNGWLSMGRETRNRPMLYNPAEFLCDQMVRADTCLEVYRSHLVSECTNFGVANYLDGPLSAREPFTTRQDIRTFTASRFPKSGSQNLMASLLGDFVGDQLRLSGSWWSTLKISYRSAEASKLEAQMRSQRAARQYKSPFKSMFPHMIEKADEWTAVNGQVQDGARLVKFSYSIMIQAPEGRGEEAERALRSLYRTRGFDLERNDCCHLPVMLSSLPMGFGDNFHKDLHQLKLMRTATTRSMPGLAPLQGQPRSSGLPATLLMTRLGQPIFYSPFQNEGNGNHNMAVVGASGSGKSVFMQCIVVDGLAQGHHAMVIDDGRSFERLCKIMGGEHVVFKADEAVSLNPFSMIAMEGDPSDDDLMAALNMINQVVTLMAVGDDRPSREETGLIDSVVSQVFAELGTEGSVTDVQKALEAEGSALGVRMARAMNPFCRGGTFGSFFHGPATLSLENPFTVFEMSDLEAKAELRPIIVLCLLFQISERMRIGGREQRKMVVIDESWQMLGNGPAGKFIEGFARRARKEGGALITGTQGVNDYYVNDASKAAFENSDWKVLLRITEEEVDSLKTSRRLAVDESNLHVVKSLKMSPGEYSELIIFGPGIRMLGRLVLDPYSATVFSSSPAVFAAIEREVSKGRPLADVIEAMARGGAAT
ncbi:MULTISPECIES: type IV secretion system protein TraC [Alphaproteobacteria]|jgi:conjugal transfer ATP-binding protein TraC|uniref:Conjugal transfer protein TraC n=2 Tax=Bacteria TaxID=2 RepID=A0A9W6INI5_9PROT|nr:type IV secretion system protein TraC [Maricaulis virginensis]GLK53536.1 conjugal transfer protein TraC [Maricaulis virginensis]